MRINSVHDGMPSASQYAKHELSSPAQPLTPDSSRSFLNLEVITIHCLTQEKAAANPPAIEEVLQKDAFCERDIYVMVPKANQGIVGAYFDWEIAQNIARLGERDVEVKPTAVRTIADYFTAAEMPAIYASLGSEARLLVENPQKYLARRKGLQG